MHFRHVQHHGACLRNEFPGLACCAAEPLLQQTPHPAQFHLLTVRAVGSAGGFLGVLMEWPVSACHTFKLLSAPADTRCSLP